MENEWSYTPAPPTCFHGVERPYCNFFFLKKRFACTCAAGPGKLIFNVKCSTSTERLPLLGSSSANMAVCRECSSYWAEAFFTDFFFLTVSRWCVDSSPLALSCICRLFYVLRSLRGRERGERTCVLLVREPEKFRYSWSGLQLTPLCFFLWLKLQDCAVILLLKQSRIV